MKVATNFYDLVVGSKVFNDSMDGIVVATNKDAETVKICWPTEDAVENYTAAEYDEYGFTAYTLV